ncbi:rubredoxin [Siculibacillus lacustris]|uniref:Rubredoxin n=1 Tax=Siculibacillus lacustris TaxID=1549641 RepID=A0A4Q9VY01_9HYPH|nr:rubredoxin [Siculibacillus lacustris]
MSISRRRLSAVVLALSALVLGCRSAWAEKVWRCQTNECGWIYNPAVGDPDHGIPPGTAFEDLPATWTCPNCGAEKASYVLR